MKIGRPRKKVSNAFQTRNVVKIVLTKNKEVYRKADSLQKKWKDDLVRKPCTRKSQVKEAVEVKKLQCLKKK